jgi:SAM-dependent methyltransferase
MARTGDFDLSKELGKPSFTPGARDAAALVDLVINGEEPAAARAAAALAKLGAVADTAIGASIGNADDGGKARLVGALGLLARAGDAHARTELNARSGDPAARVRKAAAVALGKLGGDDARAALIARWDAGDAAPEERRALAEALGKLGGDDARARLQALDAGDDAELARRRDRAVIMVERSAGRDAVSRIRDDAAPPAPLVVELGCRPGLGGLLGDELAALGIAARLLGDRGAELRLTRPLGSLFGSRLWATLEMPFPLAAGDDLAAAIVQTITAPGILGLLRAWTEGPIRWRLGFSHGHKRAVIWRVARDVSVAVPELINDPTATTWDAIVDDNARTLALAPRRLEDPRFAYRVADMPAASHPTVAAALAWLGEARATDRVWDPFCGSGLELVERARRGAVRSLLGTDLDATALDAARANLAAAGVAGELAIADARSHAPGSVDLIVTNPPLGSRVRLDATALLAAALPNFARALAPGGRLVWITPAPRRTTPVAEQLGLACIRRYPVDLGGVRGQLERWDRPPR